MGKCLKFRVDSGIVTMHLCTGYLMIHHFATLNYKICL